MKFKNIVAIVSAALVCMGCPPDPGPDSDSTNLTEDTKKELMQYVWKYINYDSFVGDDYIDNTMEVIWLFFLENGKGVGQYGYRSDDTDLGTSVEVKPFVFTYSVEGTNVKLSGEYIATSTYSYNNSSLTSANGRFVYYKDRVISQSDKEWVKEVKYELMPDASGEINGHAYVDLGLSVYWATMNIGASSVSDYGYYFLWGETTERFTYDWVSYKWCNGNGIESLTLKKYNTQSQYGAVDNKTVLDFEDDAARANWGGIWRMPTYNELKELVTKCIWTWTTQNNVNGYRVKGLNGNTIFLPAAGYHWDNSYYHAYGEDGVGSEGEYWSSSLCTDDPTRAWILDFHSDYFVMGNYGGRYLGQSVRAVCSKNGGGGNNDGNNGNEPTVIPPTEPTVSSPTGYNNSHAYVDLGLSVKWATMNIGASSVSDYGNYFAWGETTTKSTYDWSTYKWCKGSYTTMTRYCTDSSYGTVDNKSALVLSDDVARQNWGGTWRMPTYEELDELQTKCTRTWTTQNGVGGHLVTGPNGNSIFLPAAGYRDGSSLYVAGSCGYYWSSSLYTSKPQGARGLNFSSSNFYMLYNHRFLGQSVRAVCP